MTDKTKQLEKLIELHSKVVERLDNTDDTLLEGPLYKGLVDERIRLRTLAAGISLDISLLESQIAADQVSGHYQYNVLNTVEKKETATKLYADGVEYPLTLYVNHDNVWTDQTLVEAVRVVFLCKCTTCKKHADHIRELRREKKE